MNKLTKFSGLSFHSRGIAYAYDNSDIFMKQVRVVFNNGFQLSVIRGLGSYGGEHGLFEIMLIPKPNGDMGPFQELHDDPLGYLTSQEVMVWIDKIGALP
ncbi:hypothetical protein C4588_02165 [Candidatus Parcubacteria bacterium]|nr:MAG: hypothetical protein C4588_02165 [Candidatus Parcubacteria bacterium]